MAQRDDENASGASIEDKADKAVDTAIEIAEERGWSGVRLVDVAARLDLASGEIPPYFPDVNSVAIAWFRRGWQARLASKPETFATWPARARIE